MDSRDPEFVRLSYFSEMAKDITSSRNLAETISHVMEHLGRVFEPENWSFLLRNQKTGNLQFVYVTGEGAEKIRGMELVKGQGVAGWVAENAQCLIVADARRDPRFTPVIDQVSGFVTRSIIAVPLVSRSRVYGVIEIVNKVDQTPFTELELHTLKAIADFAAIAIERVYYMRAMKKLALTDSLTGLNNRRSFDRFLDREIERTKRLKSIFALLILDIDYFKAINDQYGHPVGDLILKTVARILTETTRKADCCARLGGDEFAVLLPDTDQSATHFLVRRIHKMVEAANERSPYPFSVSIGARVVDVNRPEEILSEADKAMYRSKTSSGEDLELDEIGDNLQNFLHEEAVEYQYGDFVGPDKER